MVANNWRTSCAGRPFPGAGRHHWGTDLDVYDRKALAAGQKVQLTPEEVAGPMAALHAWLDQNIERFDFFRPYREDLGGVAVEAWHLSYRPVARQYFELYDFSLFQEVIAHPELQLADEIAQRDEEIFQRYVRNISDE